MTNHHSQGLMIGAITNRPCELKMRGPRHLGRKQSEWKRTPHGNGVLNKKQMERGENSRTKKKIRKGEGENKITSKSKTTTHNHQPPDAWVVRVRPEGEVKNHKGREGARGRVNRPGRNFQMLKGRWGLWGFALGRHIRKTR